MPRDFQAFVVDEAGEFTLSTQLFDPADPEGDLEEQIDWEGEIEGRRCIVAGVLTPEEGWKLVFPKDVPYHRVRANSIARV
jgi:hypothetical protein